MMIMIDVIDDDDYDSDYGDSNYNNDDESHALVSIATRCDHAEGMQVEAR